MKRILSVFVIMLLLTSCGSEIVARVGNVKINTDEFKFYLNSIKTQMQSTELKTDEDWETQEIEGKKAIDIARERAMESAIKNALYIEASKAAGITFSSEDITKNRVIKNRIMDNYGGPELYKQYLKKNNITDRFMNLMIESSAYLTRIEGMMSTENPETEEELLEYYEQNKSDLEARFKKAKHILLLTTEGQNGIPLSMNEKENARRTAQQVLKRVRSGEDFDELMHEFSEDPGLATNPDGYVFTSGEMVAAFEECVDSMDYDEIAMCESEFGYHIVKRLPVSYEDLKEHIIKEVRTAKVDEKVYAWAEEYGIEVQKFEEMYKDIK